jgi:hypothetical protein
VNPVSRSDVIKRSASRGYSNAEYLLALYRVTRSTVANTGAAGRMPPPFVRGLGARRGEMCRSEREDRSNWLKNHGSGACHAGWVALITVTVDRAMLMSIKRRSIRLLLMALAVAIPLAAGPAAEALPSRPFGSRAVVLNPRGVIIEVAWKATATPADKAAFETAIVGTSLATPSITDPGPTYPVLYCSYGNYLFRDTSGNMSLRHNCPYRNINWAWTMSPTLLAISVGACNETGMRYTVNGVAKPMNAAHPNTPCNYIFHGTLSGVYNADLVTYSDDYYFPVKGGGTAHVHTFGTVIASSS